MSKGLEAVNRVVKNAIALRDRDEFESDMLIIAKELKALEIIKKRLSPLARATFLPMTQDEFELIEEILCQDKD